MVRAALPPLTLILERGRPPSHRESTLLHPIAASSPLRVIVGWRGGRAIGPPTRRPNSMRGRLAIAVAGSALRICTPIRVRFLSSAIIFTKPSVVISPWRGPSPLMGTGDVVGDAGLLSSSSLLADSRRKPEGVESHVRNTSYSPWPAWPAIIAPPPPLVLRLVGEHGDCDHVAMRYARARCL